MTVTSHDQNFKNLFHDFPREALEWILPEVFREFGPIRHVEFLRQEPRKRRLSDAHLALDMPILFRFDRREIILWLAEFQEDKTRFSIHRLLRYTTDMSEAHPDTLVIPTVLFTDRIRWQKDVARSVTHRFGNRLFLHFEYVFVRLFDLRAKDHYNSTNPLVRILLPKMRYEESERGEVFHKALKGLFDLTTLALFEKYVDFIDLYSKIPEPERLEVFRELEETPDEAMITFKQYLMNKGIDQGIQQGETRVLCRQMVRKFGLSPEVVAAYLAKLNEASRLELSDRLLEWESFDQAKTWMERHAGN